MPKAKRKRTSSDTLHIQVQKPIVKRLEFCGTSEGDLAVFPQSVKNMIGYDLFVVQKGGQPIDFKQLKDLPGICEVRVQDLGAWYRAAYVFKLSEAVFVLHCFQKWTNAMSKNDREIIEERYKEALRRNEQLKRQKSSNDNRQEI